MNRKISFSVITLLILLTLNLSACTISASKNQFVTITPTLLSSVEQTYLEQSTQIANPNATAASPSNLSEYEAYTEEEEDDSSVPVFPTFTPIANPNLVSTATPLSFTPSATPQTTLAPVQSTAALNPTTAPTAATQSITHLVAYGESIWCLARRYDIDPTALMNANGLNSQSWLTVDQSLTIPANSDPFPGQRRLSAHPTQYTVNYGDSLAAIACLFGDVTPAQIANANAQPATWQPTAGTVIEIP